MSGFRRERTRHESGDEILVVTDLETLRIVSEPTRFRLLQSLQAGPKTVKELAADLKVPQTRLYYHVKLLEECGAIHVISTRTVSGIIEKTYAAAASRLSLDRTVLSPGAAVGNEGIEALLAFVLDGAKAEIRRSYVRGWIDPSSKDTADGGLTLGRDWFVLTPTRMREFQRRLGDLEDEFGSRETPTEIEAGAVRYELVIGIYPIESRDNEPHVGNGNDER